MNVNEQTGLPQWGYNASHLPASDLRHPETLARALEYSLNREFIAGSGDQADVGVGASASPGPGVDNVRIEVQLLVDAWGGTNVERMLHFMRT